MPGPTPSRAELHAMLARALRVPEAFPWQSRLLDRMLADDLPRSLDLPTGLGKTAVIAIWLVARAAGAGVPRRLVYVVDRRAVVDQATQVAEGLRQLVDEDAAFKRALGLRGSLPISTLRGKFLDNREWLADPGVPAIVLGTVDMIGSRLLFEGYRVSRRMRPYHAGLLGIDSLLVLDEAHLVPPFEHLVRAAEAAPFAPSPLLPGTTVHPLRVLSLSATGRDHDDALTIEAADRTHRVVARRLTAKKQLVLRDEGPSAGLAGRLADEAWALAQSAGKPVRCIVFCDSRKVAQAVRDALVARSPEVELFVGGRRIWEREEAARWLASHGFLASSEAAPDRHTFVIATSAGEVGVDLDADHMACDLVAWERMVQRLGRVNRRGNGDARIIVTPEASSDDAVTARRVAVRTLLRELPTATDGSHDVSPGALLELKERMRGDEPLRALVERASTPEPLHPALTRPLVDAWSMTSLEDHTGRPEIDPWLRGWPEEPELPQTTIVWRERLPLDAQGKLLAARERELFRDVAAPHLAEQLETEVPRALDWLTARLRALAKAATSKAEPPSAPLRPDDVAAVLLGRSTSSARAIRVRDTITKQERDRLERELAGAVLLVDHRVGGLSNGLLDDHQAEPAADVTTLKLDEVTPAVPLRVRPTGEERAPEDGWRVEATIAIAGNDDGDETEWLSIETPASVAAESEEGRSVTRHPQELDEHETWAEDAARDIGHRIGLPKPYLEMLALAARLHDEGKRAKCWQRAFRAPNDGKDYGKTAGRPDLRLLGRYRHELGSLPRAERDARVRDLDDDMRDLLLHLIAAHHGYARPLLRTDGAEEPPTVLTARAQAIALRFLRLQKRWGPWGLAWWEALLRAADQQASRRHDEGGSSDG